MRAVDAKAIRMSVLLSALGYTPVRETGGEKWYLSPFRDEKDASFKLTADDRAWYDHGLGKGGNIIDFAMLKFSTDVSGALREIERHVQSSPAQTTLPLFGEPAAPDRVTASVPPPAPVAAPRPAPAAHAVTIKPLATSTLCNYLRHQRRIDLAVAKTYLQEVWFKLQPHGRWLFALAFPNDSGGYEWRNASDTNVYKRAWGGKNISTIQPTSGETPTTVMVFEGFMDFLSALTYYRVATPRMPVIILNGTGMKDTAITAIRAMGVQKVHLYLDRDASGQQLTADFQAALSDRIVLDQSTLYQDHKDFNAFLQHQRTPQISS